MNSFIQNNRKIIFFSVLVTMGLTILILSKNLFSKREHNIYFVSQKKLVELERKRIGNTSDLFNGKQEEALEIIKAEVNILEAKNNIVVITDSIALNAKDITEEIHQKIIKKLQN